MAKKKKLRTSFRKNREVRTREGDLTRQFEPETSGDDDSVRGERISGKGDLTRHRTIAGAEIAEDVTGQLILPEIDHERWLEGRVLRVQGLVSLVRDADGKVYSCATRRLLKSLSTDQRHVVAAGDRIWF